MDVVDEHGAADVFLVRLDAVRDGGHDVCEALVLTADGPFTARRAQEFALQILAAVRQLADGLPDAPGGIPAALAALPADTTHSTEGDTHV